MQAEPQTRFGEEFYSSVIEAAPDGIVIADSDGRIVLANHHAAEMFGYDDGELVGMSVDLLLPERLQQGHRAHRLRYRAEPTVRPMGIGRQLRARHRNGRESPVEISLSPLYSDGDLLVVAVVRDITARIEDEERLRRVLHTLDATDDGVFILDAGTLRFSYVNAGAARQVGYGRDELIGMTPMHLNPALDEAEFRRLAAPLLEDAAASVDVETVHRRRDGVDVPVEMSLRSTRSTHDDAVALIAVARDITVRREAEAQVRAGETALREAAQGLAIADDRERIARDLHDTVIQRLFASGLQLQAIGARVAPDVRERIDVIVDGLDDTIRELRTAIFALQSPAGHGERGLRGELLDAVIDAASGLGFEPRLQFDGAIETIDDRVREHVVPVVREALTNIARHAGARTARVIVDAGERVVVTVVDDGAGVPDDVLGGRGLGNLTERARQLGGEMQVSRRPEGGTRLVWAVPACPPD